MSYVPPHLRGEGSERAPRLLKGPTRNSNVRPPNLPGTELTPKPALLQDVPMPGSTNNYRGTALQSAVQNGPPIKGGKTSSIHHRDTDSPSEATLQARALRFASPSSTPSSSPRPSRSARQNISPQSQTSSGPSSSSSQPHQSSSGLDSPDLKLREELDIQAEDRAMECLGTLSRSGTRGVGAILDEGDALKDEKVQERYMAYIERRLEQFHRLHPEWPSPKSSSLVPHQEPARSGSTLSDKATEDISSVMLCFRKLREGVLSSGRADDFAVRVYELSASYAILSGNHPQIVSSLSILVPGLYARAAATSISADAPRRGNHVEDGLADLSINGDASRDKGMLSSDGTDKRGLYACLLLTYSICHQGDVRAWWKLWFRLTMPTRSQGQSAGRRHAADASNSKNLRMISKMQGELEAFISAKDPYMVLAKNAFEAHTAPSPRRFAALTAAPTDESARLRSDLTALEQGLFRAVLTMGQDKVRERSWSTVRAAYRDLGVGWTAKILMLDGGKGTDNETLDEWQDGAVLTQVRSWVETHGARIDGHRVIIKG